MLNTTADNKHNSSIRGPEHAFDCLQYQTLLKKMESIGFEDRTFNWFRSDLSIRRQCVDMDGKLSNWQAVKLGVLQGLIIFLIYVNNIMNSFLTPFLKKFADTTAIFTGG